MIVAFTLATVVVAPVMAPVIGGAARPALASSFGAAAANLSISAPSRRRAPTPRDRVAARR